MKIADYAFLSDCQSAALVARDGSVDWLTLPRFDSPSVFARILGADGGHWRLRPSGEYEQERSYVGDSVVLRSVLHTSGGAVEIRDALALEPGSRAHDIGLKVPHVLLREVRGLEGEADLEMEFSPRFEYGLTIPRLTLSDDGVIARGGSATLELRSPVSPRVRSSTATASFRVRAGESVPFSLAYASTFSGPPPRRLDVSSALQDTLEGWRSWLELHQGYRGAYLDRVRRSAVVLQGLTYQPSGAVVAAATTSLPEIIGGDANWDYRYTWLRDMSLTLQAQWVAACPHEANRFFAWLEDAGGRVADQEHVQIMFGAEGERDLTEHVIDHLEGFRGSAPVRVGNDAWKQKQLDVLGEVLDSAYLLRQQLGELDEPTKELLVGMANRAAQSWKGPDAGMWEARDKRRHYLTSKVMCWVALDRATKLSLGSQAEAKQWRAAADEIHNTILRDGWSDKANSYAGALGSDELDASVLLMPLVGFLPATDDRMRATIETIERELATDGVVHRWDGDPNGFIITSYWLVECLALASELERAREWFERITAYGNDLGLLSEEVNGKTGELVGNFPQAFSHVGLINAAYRITNQSGPENERLS